MRIKRREFLLILLVLSQFGCIALGLVWGASWLHTWLTRSFEQRAQAESRAVAQQTVVQLTRARVSSFEPGTRGWEVLQELATRTTATYDGQLWAIRRDTGALIVHPGLRHDPSLLRRLPGLVTMVSGSKAETLLQAIEDAEFEGRHTVAGNIYLDGKLKVVTAIDLPESNVVLLVLQDYDRISQAAAELVDPAQRIGWIFTFAVVGGSSLLTVVLINRYEDTLAQSNVELESQVESRTKSLLRTRNAVIFALAKLAESRDKDTGDHLERIRAYVTILANEMARSHKEINHKFVADLAVASSLHDVGKVGIPDSVLLKPERLTAAEHRAMQLHTLLGAECLASIQKQLGDDDFLELARQIALSHHEHWDGAGYPNNLQGQQIPLPARIVALADVYDALTSTRPYKRPCSHAEAREWIATRYGSQFDPEVVEAFMARDKEFAAISQRHARTLDETTDAAEPQVQALPATDPAETAATSQT